MKSGETKVLKRKTVIAGVMLVIILSLTGCNTNKNTENIKQGFDAITALEYEEALTYFVTATEAKENPQQIARDRELLIWD